MSIIFLKLGLFLMVLIGQNSIHGNFPSSFECTYARAGYSFSFAFGKGKKWGVEKGGYIGGGVGGEKKGGKKGGKKGKPFPFLLNFHALLIYAIFR